jgi:methionyl-tRNA formyltransferase
VRVVYVGTLGECACIPLLALLAAKIEVVGVVVPAPDRGRVRQRPPIRRLEPETPASLLPIATPFVNATIVTIAWEHDIPAFEVGALADPATLATWAALQPDVACVTCFPRRIPVDLLRVPRFGFLNLHPSLLPAYRGPAPLFWMLRNGEQTGGVTLHVMDQSFDTGDIVSQVAFPLPDGSSGAELDRYWTTCSAELLLDGVRALNDGSFVRRRQPDGGSYQSWPAIEDFTIDRNWSARHAFNFMRGTDQWGHSYRIMIDNESFELTAALDYDADITLETEFVLRERDIWIQFNPGILHATLI